ncbi:MAG: hypothetical protein IJ642_05975 [Oscillospiraceae bacterium]|nr:hypothetical protein [Oscillospiraceae bacterium]
MICFIVKGNLIQGIFLEANAPAVQIKSGGSLTVTGDYRHYGGELNIADDTLEINGSYHQAASGRGDVNADGNKKFPTFLN